MGITEGEATYSISVRLMRTTVEYAYVGVPVVGDLVKPDDEGVPRLVGKLVMDWAVEMGQEAGVVWYREAQQIEPHPIQKAPEPGESRYPG